MPADGGHQPDDHKNNNQPAASVEPANSPANVMALGAVAIVFESAR